MMRLLSCLVVLSTALATEKQIRLEDIEKDNLKSDQQTKFEKQYQQYQTQGLHYQTPQPLQYQSPQAQHYQSPQALQYQSPQSLHYQQPAIAFQPTYSPQQQGPSPYSQYVLPYNAQQYLQQGIFQGNYAQLGSNTINGAYQPPNPMQQYSPYYSQQLQQVGVGGAGNGASPQALLMAYANANPTFAALQQQAAAYYQGLNLQQYMGQGQHSPAAALYYQQQPEVTPTESAAVPASPSAPTLYAQQHYIPSYQTSRIPPSSLPASPTYTISSSQSPSPSPYTTSQSLSPSIDSSAYLSALKQSAQTSASIGQQHQFLQAVASTVSPLQAKYQNSPHYLAQNYNTIPSTHLLTKSAYSGVKPTATPILKVSSQGGFIPNNPNTSSSANHPVYRSLSG